MPLQRKQAKPRATHLAMTALATLALLGSVATPILGEPDPGDGGPGDGGPGDGGPGDGGGIGSPPVFTAPLQPRCGSTTTATAGKTLTFDVDAKDPDKDEAVTLDATGLPPEASFTGGTGNPALGTFTWTLPAQQQGQTVLTFHAEDPNANQATCTITINVALPVSVGLRNPGFEGPSGKSSGGCGLDSWTQGTIADSATALTTDTDPTPAITAPLGSCMARLGTSTANGAATQPAGTTTISQEFIASNTAKVAFQTNVFSYDSTGTDQAGWEILNAKDEIVASHWTKTWGPGGDTTLKTTGWQTWTPRLPEGQLLRLRLTVINGAEANPTWMYVDAADPDAPTKPWVQAGPPVEDPRKPAYVLGPYTYHPNPDGTLTVALSKPGMAAGPRPLDFGAYVTCPDGSTPSEVRLLLNDRAADNPMSRPVDALPTWFTTVPPDLGGIIVPGGSIPAGDVVAGQLRLQVTCGGAAYLAPVGNVVFYDPLGTVRDATDCADPAVPATCKPIADATATLYDAPIFNGACDLSLLVEPHSGIQPAVNPMRTNARGEFGWTNLPADSCYSVNVRADDYEPRSLWDQRGPFGDILLTPTAEALKKRTGLVQLTIPNMPLPIKGKGAFSVGHVETIRLQFARDTGEVLGTCDATRGQVTCQGEAIAHRGLLVQLPVGKHTLSVIPGSNGVSDRWTPSTQSLTIQHAKTTKVTVNAATDNYILRLHGNRPGELEVQVKQGDKLLATCILGATASCDPATPKTTTDGQHIFLPPAEVTPPRPKLTVVLTPEGTIADTYHAASVLLHPQPNKPAAVPIRLALKTDGILQVNANGQGLGAHTVGFSDGSMCTFQPGEDPTCAGKAIALPGNKIALAPGKLDWNAKAIGSFKPLKGTVIVQKGREVPLALSFRPAQAPTVEIPKDIVEKMGTATVTIRSEADGTLGTCVVSATSTTCDTAGKLTSQKARFITIEDGTGPFRVLIGSDAYLWRGVTISGKNAVEQARPILQLMHPTVTFEVRPAHLREYEVFVSSKNDPLQRNYACHVVDRWHECTGSRIMTVLYVDTLWLKMFLPAGEYVVTAKAPGHKELKMDLNLGPGKQLSPLLNFEPR